MNVFGKNLCKAYVDKGCRHFDLLGAWVQALISYLRSTTAPIFRTRSWRMTSATGFSEGGWLGD